MKLSYLMPVVFYLVSWTCVVGQEIEKLDKKELRIELSVRRSEIDSLKNINLSLQSQIKKHKHYKDSLISILEQVRLTSEKIEAENIEIKKEIIDLETQNKGLVKKIDTLIDSLISSKNQRNSSYFTRELLINKYLKNKTFKIKYYNSHDGTGPDGGSFTSITEIDDKYYIGDVSNGSKQLIKLANNSQISNFNSWRLIIKDNLEFNYRDYRDGNKVVQGSISYEPIKWLDFVQSDSIYFSSVIINEDQLKLPIGIIELGTIRGPFDFMIYFLVGERRYWFNGKEYRAFNPIILESNNVEIIMTQTN